MFKSIPLLCRSLIIALLASALIGAFVQSTWVGLLGLHSVPVLEGLQVWRLFTYPFVTGIGSAIVSSLFIWFFGSELEQILHTKKLLALLAISIIAGGVIFILIDPNGVLIGPPSISMFILAGFAYMWPQREISILGIFWLRAWIIALIYFIFSFIPLASTMIDLSASAIFAPIYSALSAIILFHLSYKQHAMPSFVSSVMPHKKQKVEDSSDPKAIEKRIDQILDKIASSGMNSLTQEEKDFLLKHSR